MALFTKTIATLGLLIATAGTAMGDTYHHIDQLANRIAENSRVIVSESLHYRHTPQYGHLVSDARDMNRFAEHMHEVAHHQGNLSHLESDLAQLDSKFHHLESLFDQVEHHAQYGHGHVHGSTSHVRRLLDVIEDDIHHLQDDLRDLRTPRHRVQRYAVPTTPARPIAYPQYNRYQAPVHGHGGHGPAGSGSRGREISFGGGNTRFSIRF